MKRRRHIDDGAEINITPMLDIVFIMLIFFIVSTSFVKEKGLEISRPGNEPPAQTGLDSNPIVIRIDNGGLISLDDRFLEPAAVQANLQRAKAERPAAPLIVAAHPDGDTGALVTVLDAAKAVGIESISVATTPE